MRTYIVDIDGTLANIDHRLHFIQQEPKQWDAFFDACDCDDPIRDVIDVVYNLDFGDPETQIIYLTGRPERIRKATLRWLEKYNLFPDQLIMRADGDHRPDTIAKRELLDRLQAAGHQIVGVFEDRPSVCRVWREMGLTVFQLNDKEF